MNEEEVMRGGGRVTEASKRVKGDDYKCIENFSMVLIFSYIYIFK